MSRGSVPTADRSKNPPSRSPAPPIVHSVLRSPGHPLDRDARAVFEPRLGIDLGTVRVHTDERAAASAQAVGAAAYAVGRDVVFARGRYVPGLSAGRRLLGHELAHVAQQRNAVGAVPEELRIGGVDDPEEADADRESGPSACDRSPAPVLRRSSDEEKDLPDPAPPDSTARASVVPDIKQASGGGPSPATDPGWQLEHVEHVSNATALFADYELVYGGPAGGPTGFYRLTPEGRLTPTSRLDEFCSTPLGAACYALHMLRGGPSAMAEQATIDIALMGSVKLVAAGGAWVRNLTTVDDIGLAGRLGAQEGAAETVEAMNPFRRTAPLGGDSVQTPALRFIGLGTDAEGGALITFEEISEAAGDVGARVVSAEALAEIPKTSGRLWLGRYGSGAIPGVRYPGQPGRRLLEGLRATHGGRTGAIPLSGVPRPEWFSHIQPLIDDADEVMFHVSTGVGLVDEATGIQYLTSEELLYILNNADVSSKTVFFFLSGGL